MDWLMEGTNAQTGYWIELCGSQGKKKKKKKRSSGRPYSMA
jgi:hypothetical protein